MFNKGNRLQTYIGFVLLVIIISFIFKILDKDNKPESFKQGVALLGQDTSVMQKIGSYQSYSYSENEFPKELDNPANIKVCLKGTAASIYLSCRIERNKLGKWQLISVHQDSLVSK